MKIIHLSTTGLALALLLGCSQPQQADRQQESVKADYSIEQESTIEVGKDYHSFANPEEIKVTHLDLEIAADFDARVLSGEATLHVKRIAEGANTLILDSRDLSISKVTVNDAEIAFSLGEADPALGTAITIDLPAEADKVTISYQTSPAASGVQWLTPEQTAGKQHPFLFTQAQAIHARSFIPLQDSPQVRMTYNATIITPPELVAVMSASNDPDTDRDGVYEFSMPQPIPSYLIALAIGDLEFKAMGQRTGVYAESYILDAAAAEFADTEAMLIETEKRFGPYSWDRYDLLILPPSFPFGGMENPRLSFITPTVIAGDKSLVALIAHELAHSWSGNTVTNATWRDLWLNEGFTTYLTYRIMEIIYGTDRFHMEAVLGYQDLQADIAGLTPNDQIMAIDLRGRDPDDVFSNIPYEKGALFLRELEQKVGRQHFDAFLVKYFEDFAFESITTDQFIDYIQTNLIDKHPTQLKLDRIKQWIFEPGIPEKAPMPESNAFVLVDEARQAWLAGDVAAKDIRTQKWTVHEWLYFLNNLPTLLDEAQMTELDAAFGLTQSSNNEIAHSWLLISINNWYEPAFDRLHEYLVTIGRNKLVKPLYRALSETEEGKVMARKAFEQAKSGYHPLTVKANEGFVN